MKKITLPKETVKVGDKTYTAIDAIREIVMLRPAWRKPGNVKLALTLEDKFDKVTKNGELVLLDREFELLSKEAELGESGGISPSHMNRYYLRVLNALYDAQEVADENVSHADSPS